jgi:hypothetical protein
LAELIVQSEHHDAEVAVVKNASPKGLKSWMARAAQRG